jgi:hypothetical protein
LQGLGVTPPEDGTPPTRRYRRAWKHALATMAVCFIAITSGENLPSNPERVTESKRFRPLMRREQ